MRLPVLFFAFTLFGILIVAGFTAQAKETEIAKLCKQNTNMPGDVCDCISKKSNDLSSQEQRMIVAMLSKDQNTAAALRSEMSVESMMNAGMFMSNASKNCAKTLHNIDIE